MSDPPSAELKLAKPPQEKQPPLFDGKGYTASWLEDQNFPETVYSVPGLIPEGTTLLVGAPKIGKSWMSLGLAIDITHGDPVLGYIETQPRKILMLALEDEKKRMQSRCRMVSGNKSWSENLVIYHNVVTDRLLHDMSMWFYQNYDPHAPPMIILDTLAKGLPRTGNNQNVYDADYKMVGGLKAITDEYSGSSIIAIHHDRKSESGDFMTKVSGSRGLTGAADTTLFLERARHSKEGTLEVTGRDVTEGKYSINIEDNGRWSLAAPTLSEASEIAESSDGQLNYGDKRKQIMDFIWQNGPISAKDIRDKFGQGTDVYLKRLVESEKIIKVGRGQYAAPIRNRNAS